MILKIKTFKPVYIIIFLSSSIWALSPVMFEKAYNLEKKEPQKAEKLYFKLLKRQLDYKLKNLVRWRLLRLAQQKNLYAESIYRLQNAAGRRYKNSKKTAYLLRKLKIKAMRDFNVSEEFIDRYHIHISNSRSCRILRKNINQLTDLHIAQGSLTSAYDFYTFLKYRKCDNIEPAAAEKFASGFSRFDLLRIEQLLLNKKYNEAIRVAENYTSKQNIKPQHRSDGYYLLAKSQRKAGLDNEAISSMRHAASFAVDEAKRERYYGLAAFRLYRTGRYEAAYRLLTGMPTSGRNTTLLKLLSECRYNRSRQNNTQCSDLKSYMRSESRHRKEYSSYLWRESQKYLP